MIAHEGQFRPKLPNQHLEALPGRESSHWSLRYQLRRATQYASNGAEPLAPPSQPMDEIMAADVTSLKAEYPKRYGMYKQAVSRAMRREPFELQDQLENTHWLHIVNSLDRYIHRNDNLPPEERTLHEPQMVAFRKLQDFLEQGNMSGYFELPTGFGKTVLFSTILKALNTPVEHYVTRDMRSALRTRALIVVPSLPLVNQTLKRLGKFAPGLDIDSISSLRRPKEGLHATVITYDSFRIRIASGKLQPSDYDVVILDEAHKLLSDKRLEAFDKFREHCLVLGFTATPGYNDTDKHIKNHIGERIHGVSLKEAVDMKMLCNFQAYTYDTGIDLSQVERTRQGEYTEDSLEKNLDYEARALVALELYQDNFAGLQGYLFCEGVTASKITADVFSKGGVPCESVTEETPKKEREEIWKRFESGKTKLLANVDLFTQGTDHAEASLVMNLNETESLVKEKQRDGRALRTSEVIKDKVAHVVNFLYRDDRRKTVTFAQIAETDPIELLRSRSTQTRQETTKTDRSEPPEKSAPPELAGLDLDAIITRNQLVEQVGVSAMEDEAPPEGLGEPEETDEQILLREKHQTHIDAQVQLYESLSDMDYMHAVVTKAVDGDFIYGLIDKEAEERRDNRSQIADVYRTDISRLFEIKTDMSAAIGVAYDAASPIIIDVTTVELLDQILAQLEPAVAQVNEQHMKVAELLDETLELGVYYDTDLLADAE